MSRDLSKVFLLKEGDREGVGQFTEEKFPSTQQKLLNKRKQKQKQKQKNMQRKTKTEETLKQNKTPAMEENNKPGNRNNQESTSYCPTGKKSCTA